MKIIKEKQIKEICKKHPKWKELFISYLNDDENLSIDQLKETFQLILNYKHIFKELIHEAKELMNINDNRSILERLNDKVTLEIHEHKKNQFIHSLKTEKYQHLFDKDIEQEIHTILDNKISIESLKHQFFNKLARYKSSGELLLDLKEFKNKNIQWNKEYYLNLIKENKLNVEILEEQNGYMNIQVNDYEACKTLGSQAWCIVKDEKIFISYTNNYNRQIISLNFDLPIENNESMIGFTIRLNGKINDSYLKNDDPTSKKTKELFHFKSLPNEKIKDILSIKNHQEAFYLICKFGLIDFYDEYINKDTVSPNNDQNKSISLASSNGNVYVVNRLLEDKRVDPSDDSNYSIRYASSNGHFEVVNRLLNDSRVDPSDNNNCAVLWASQNGHVNIVNRLLDDPKVNPSDKNNYAIIWASENGHSEVVNRLLDDPRVDPSADNNFAIRCSSENGHFEVVNRLLDDSRVDPSADNNYSICYASKNGHFEVVNRLLDDPRVDPSDDNNYAIRWASYNGYLNIVNRLLDYQKVDPSVDNNFAIRYAYKNGHLKIVNQLLEDKRVCKTLDKKWVKNNLYDKQFKIFIKKYIKLF